LFHSSGEDDQILHLDVEYEGMICVELYYLRRIIVTAEESNLWKTNFSKNKTKLKHFCPPPKVEAAASTPSSFTSIKVFWMTLLTNKFLSLMPLKLAAGVKALLAPN
jgi:hypothetical protein